MCRFLSLLLLCFKTKSDFEPFFHYPYFFFDTRAPDFDRAAQSEGRKRRRGRCRWSAPGRDLLLSGPMQFGSCSLLYTLLRALVTCLRIFTIWLFSELLFRFILFHFTCFFPLSTPSLCPASPLIFLIYLFPVVRSFLPSLSYFLSLSLLFHFLSLHCFFTFSAQRRRPRLAALSAARHALPPPVAR